MAKNQEAIQAMKPNQLSAYTAHRAGILITGKIDLEHTL